MPQTTYAGSWSMPVLTGPSLLQVRTSSSSPKLSCSRCTPQLPLEDQTKAAGLRSQRVYRQDETIPCFPSPSTGVERQTKPMTCMSCVLVLARGLTVCLPACLLSVRCTEQPKQSASLELAAKSPEFRHQLSISRLPWQEHSDSLKAPESPFSPVKPKPLLGQNGLSSVSQ